MAENFKDECFDEKFVAETTIVEDVSNNDLKTALWQRKSKRSTATKLVNKTLNELDNLNTMQKNSKLKSMSDCKSELKAIDLSILKIYTNDPTYSTKDLDKLVDCNEIYQEKLINAISVVEDSLAADSAANLSNFSSDPRMQFANIGLGADQGAAVPSSMLPKIPLPTFSGNKLEFLSFKMSFQSAFSDKKLTNLQKFCYLYPQLKDDAQCAYSNKKTPL